MNFLQRFLAPKQESKTSQTVKRNERYIPPPLSEPLEMELYKPKSKGLVTNVPVPLPQMRLPETDNKLSLDRKQSKALAIPDWNINTIATIPVEEFKGWKLLGILEHKPIGTRLVEAKDQHIPKHYFIDEARCDWCKKTLYRKYTYIIQNNQTKEIKQLGSTCVKGFFEGEVT